MEGHLDTAATIHARVADAREQLLAAGVPLAEADLDARLLAQHALGWDSAHFFRELTSPPPPSLDPAFALLLQRRIQREPMAYILGTQEFWNLTFEVTPAVLIPRPETEGVVEAVLHHLPDRNARVTVADVCTGSGCLAVVLATLYPLGQFIATDISQDALEVARRNAVRHGVSGRIRFMQADVLNGIDQPFDLIVSNPPYVPARERLNLPPEVRDHEPTLALFAGDDGLMVIDRLVHSAPDYLRGEGLLIFEFGFGQESSVRAFVEATPGMRLLEIRPDLQGIPRTALAVRGKD